MRQLFGNSIPLGRVLGIPISIHWTFFILLFWIVGINFYRSQTIEIALWTGAFLLVIFFCVFLHELGHAIAARHYGIGTKSIVMLPIGGVASLEKIPEEPPKEIVISLAGPAVNIIIAIILYLILMFKSKSGTEVLAGESLGPDNFIFMILIANILLGVFNLIPAFPMDGGRVLRAFLSLKMNRVKATGVALNITTFIAILFVILGILNNPILVFIALFVYLGANAEYESVKVSASVSGSTAADVLMKKFTILNDSQPIEVAVHELLNSQETRFLVSHEGKIASVLTKTDIIKALSENGADKPINQYASKIEYWADLNTDLKVLLDNMVANHYSIVPVNDGDEIVGVVDIENIREFITISSLLKQTSA